MDRRLADLLRLLELERIEINLFRGEPRHQRAPGVRWTGPRPGTGGGLRHGTERMVHSLHAYFLRPGDFNAPIVYEVDRSRDGQSFSSRRVTAIQHGEQIFNMAASFQAPQEGVEHQLPMPKVPPPEDLKDMDTHHREMIPQIPEKLRRLFEHQRPFEFRPVRVPDYFKREKLEPIKHVWFRAVDTPPPDQALQRCLLAYVSDYHLLDTATLPHGISWLRSDVRLASIDHAMWFHADVQIGEWLLLFDRQSGVPPVREVSRAAASFRAMASCSPAPHRRADSRAGSAGRSRLMLRAILVFALVLGIVVGGLLLLRRTANMQPPIPKRDHPPADKIAANKDDDEDDEESW